MTSFDEWYKTKNFSQWYDKQNLVQFDEHSLKFYLKEAFEDGQEKSAKNLYEFLIWNARL